MLSGIPFLLLAFLLAPRDYFVIRIVDEETGRGVPLVELTLPNEVRYYTDSAGVAALQEPSFMGRNVWVRIASHGYEYQKEVFGDKGQPLDFKAGGSVELKIRRKMIAERLYRLTGEGIYRDSMLTGRPVPFPQAPLPGSVVGQDTAAVAIYKGKAYWIWGDTVSPDSVNFEVTGATSELPGRGGLDPSVGVRYRYFTDKQGRPKHMLPLGRGGLVWIEGLFVLRDPQGQERLLATWTRQPGLKPPVECGIARFDDAQEVFTPWLPVPCRDSHVSSHPVVFRENGREYLYLYPNLRLENTWDGASKPEFWEKRQVTLPSKVRPSCVTWNEYRKKFLLLLENTGEVWYAEGDRPEGPYTEPVRIVHHEKYNFYNVVHHPFMDQEGGKVIYFEGTYTDAFSAAGSKTPRYNYNQVLYRLRLDDSRLKPAQR